MLYSPASLAKKLEVDVNDLLHDLWYLVGGGLIVRATQHVEATQELFCVTPRGLSFVRHVSTPPPDSHELQLVVRVHAQGGDDVDATEAAIAAVWERLGVTLSYDYGDPVSTRRVIVAGVDPGDDV